MYFIIFFRDNPAEQLWVASRDGLHDQVEDLLKKGGDPNSEYYKRKHNGSTPLHEACSNNHPQTAKLLLQQGAYLKSLNSDNDIPLKVAVIKNSMECVKLLMDHCSPTGESIIIGAEDYILVYVAVT